MLHTNITSFFLRSMNHVQAEMPPRQTTLDAVASSICELTELMGFPIQDNSTHTQSVTPTEWKSRLTMSIATSKARNQRCFQVYKIPSRPRLSQESVCLYFFLTCRSPR